MNEGIIPYLANYHKVGCQDINKKCVMCLHIINNLTTNFLI